MFVPNIVDELFKILNKYNFSDEEIFIFRNAITKLQVYETLIGNDNEE